MELKHHHLEVGVQVAVVTIIDLMVLTDMDLAYQVVQVVLGLKEPMECLVAEHLEYLQKTLIHLVLPYLQVEVVEMTEIRELQNLENLELLHENPV